MIGGNIRSTRCALLALTGATLGTAALAGPPYMTDDPVPTDAGKWEIYAFGTGTHFHHATEGEAGLDINYGAAKDLQISAVIPFEYETHERTRLGDVELGAKYMVVHQRDGSVVPDVSFYPNVTLPTAAEHRGSRKIGAFLPLFVQKDIDKWSMFGGGGYQINPGAGNKDFWEIGYAVTRQLNDKLDMGAEIYHSTADEIDGKASTGLGIGMEYEIAEKWSILASGGPIVQNRHANGRYAFYIGLAFAN